MRLAQESLSAAVSHTQPTKTLTEVPPATIYGLSNYTDIVFALQYFEVKKAGQISQKIVQIDY